MVNKEQWPEGTVISLEGFFSPDGELLSGEPHTQADIDEWNGTTSDLPETTVTTTSDDSPETPKVKPKAAKKKKKPAKKEKKWFKK